MKNFKKALAVFALFFITSNGAVLAQAQNQTPQLKIVTPSDGQTIYGDAVPVLFSVDNFQLTDFKTNLQPVSGQGHIHLWLDDTNPTADTAVKLIEDNYTFTNVAPGDHTLHAELVNNDHTPLNPPQTATVQFKSAAVGSASNQTPESSFDKNTALVILVVVSLVIVAAWWYTKEDDEDMEKQETTSTKPKTKRKATKKKTKRKN